MSLQLFIKDVSSEPLTITRLEKVWDNCNLNNKSPLIDQLMGALHKQLQLKATAEGVALADVSIPGEDVQKMCAKFTNILILQKIPPKEPMLETIMGSPYGIDPTWKINPATSIVFKQHKVGDKNIWVAVKVLAANKAYDLQTKHFNICISNGWYFATSASKDYINCPFRVKL